MTPLSHLDKIESESIYILREVVSRFENPVMLYSIGKDSAVMLHLAIKAFAPGKIPFKLLHVDTTWKFKEMIEFRDRTVKELDLDLIIHINQDGIKKGINPISNGSKAHTDIMKTEALKQALNLYKFDSALGGARRDEEKSRSKERIFSFRSENHSWDAKNQRPELWNHFNTHLKEKESVRVFPLSNWTEIDIWNYIRLQNIPIVPLYRAKVRPIIRRNGLLIMADDSRLKIKVSEKIENMKVRFRTLGCYPLTAAIKSEAVTIEEIISELMSSKSSERQGRLIDHDQIGAMEKKKQEGYF
jgi:sulfate adenylyltransferase subunit 2